MIDEKEIVKEVANWFDTEYPGVHNEVRHSKCLRDTGYNLTAILKDLRDGGISETCKVSKKYWQGAASQLPKSEREYAIAVNNKLGEVLKQSVPEEQMEKVDRLISNINDVTTFGASSDYIDAMKFRENIHFFKQDEYPKETSIRALIRDTHELVPHKNNMIECNITVYGPEHAKEKEKLVLSTMCGKGREHWREGGKHENDYVLLKEVYDKWVKSQMRPRVMVDKSPYPSMQFNEQVRAPYLLVYTQRLRKPTESQLKRGFQDNLFNLDNENYEDSLSWYISAAMHGISLAYLAGDRNISASFCKCYSWSDHNPTEILKPVKVKWKTPSRLSPERLSPAGKQIGGKQVGGNDRVSIDMKRIAFMIGLGYADKNGYYPKHINYSTTSEYVKWK